MIIEGHFSGIKRVNQIDCRDFPHKMTHPLKAPLTANQLRID
jgi:hypothetical protein